MTTDERTTIGESSYSQGRTPTHHVWRFGYGSNIGLNVLKQKKNLNPKEYHIGTIRGWSLTFNPAIPFVEPAFAGVYKSDETSLLHGSAFLIPEHEAEGLDKQESGYIVQSSKFVSYDGEQIHDVGLYVPKNQSDRITAQVRPDALPSLRYLRLLQNGAREGKLAKEWIDRLDNQPYYITPKSVREQTFKLIQEFEDDSQRYERIWTMKELSKHDGTNNYPTHTSVMEYVVRIDNMNGRVFPAWKGHNITRRNLLQFSGKSLDANDVRYGEEGFRPLPSLQNCSNEEKEYLMQNLETLLHRGGIIVGRLQDFLDDQVKTK